MSNSYKILIVDDEKSIRDAIRLILEMEGYKIKELDNGYDVEATIQNWEPDMVLLDVMMGECDGRDICAKVKENPITTHIPIIIVSATHGLATAHEKNCNANAYLAKPFDIDALVNLIDKHL